MAPPFQDRALVFRLDEQRYESDFYNEFFVAPRAMVTARLAEWLGARGLFGAVAAAIEHAGAPYALEGWSTNVRRFASRAQRRIHHAGVRDRKPTPDAPYRARAQLQPPFWLPDRSAESVAKGLSQAFQQCLMDLERDLRGLQLSNSQLRGTRSSLQIICTAWMET